MRIITATILILACLSIPFAGQEKPPQQHNPPAVAQTQPAARAPAGEVQALREDLERMKELVRQMESNLAFVDTTQSPLKHQFQLEIDMWRTVIAGMERRLAAMSH
jgi:hypothetical protein